MKTNINFVNTFINNREKLIINFINTNLLVIGK